MMTPSLLRAFRHPGVIASILILLLNDHVLKIVSPSFVTGKLSDFAGLFFFPFVIGTGLEFAWRGLASRGRRIAPETALYLAFALTGLAFTAFKTLPVVNTWAEAHLTVLFGMPVRIILDPTDLLALVMFIPAWSLWRSISSRSAQDQPGRWTYAVLGLASLASLATSPCPPTPTFTRLAVIGQNLYATLYDSGSQPAKTAYESQDGGRTWELQETPPEAVLQDLNRERVYPLTLCDPANPLSCFRINQQPRVESSKDGGQTWSTAYAIPLERQSYMRRVAAPFAIVASCASKDPNLIPRDLIFLPGQDGSTLLVAMGNEGLLKRLSSGVWQRDKTELLSNGNLYQTITPTPTRAESLGQAFASIEQEMLVSIGVIFLAFLGLSVWLWNYAAQHRRENAPHDSSWVFRPLLIPVRYIALLVFLYFLLTLPSQTLSVEEFNLLSGLLVIAGIALPPIVILVSAIIWYRASVLVAQPRRFRWLAVAILLISLVVALAVNICFIFWALGVLVTYEAALAVAIVFDGIILVLGIQLIRRRLLKTA